MEALEVVCPEPGAVRLETRPLASPGPGEALVEVLYSAVSPGTERAWFLQEPDAPVRFPYRPGYAEVGVVRAIGPGVRGLAVGDRVVADGPHASHVLLAAERLLPVPAGVDPVAAAFAPLGAIALQGVRRAGVELGASTCVLGAGLIGLLALRLAREAGAHPLAVGEPSAFRRERAQAWGACPALPPEELVPWATQVASPASRPGGFVCVLDATGHPDAFATAVAVAAEGARVVLLGSPRGRAREVDLYAIHRKGLAVLGAHTATVPRRDTTRGRWTRSDDLRLLLALLADGRLAWDGLVTDVVAPDGVPGLFARLAARDERLLGAVIDWRLAAR